MWLIILGIIVLIALLVVPSMVLYEELQFIEEKIDRLLNNAGKSPDNPKDEESTEKD
ncbi:MAG: hypothetical protein K6G40_07470 [Eubacterium sp.]|nr:hypothetical protein [Eubacterium sp.]